MPVIPSAEPERLFAVCVGCVLLFSISGCGNSKVPTATSKTSASETGSTGTSSAAVAQENPAETATYDISKNNLEKVFGVKEEWADEYPSTRIAVVKALIGAREWLDETNNKDVLVNREEACRFGPAQDLQTSSSFIRSLGSDLAVATSAIGLPLANSHGFPPSILMRMEAATTPFAKRAGVWKYETKAASKPPETTETCIRSSEEIDERATETPQEWQLDVMRKVSALQRPLLSVADSQTLPTGAAFSIAILVFKAPESFGVVHFLS